MATPEEMQRALAMYSGGQSALDQQDEALKRQQENDALMSGVGQQPQVMSEPVMSEAPQAPAMSSSPYEPVDPAAVSSVPEEALMSEPLASYPEAPPAALRGPQELAPGVVGAPAAVPAPVPTGAGQGGRVGGVIGGAMRRPSLLSEQTAALGAAADKAEQSKQEADALTEETAKLTEDKGVTDAANAQAQAEYATETQGDLELIGRTHEQVRAARQETLERKLKESEQLNKQAAQIQIRDRRSTTQRVMGALAIAMGGLADQANLAAGLNIGMNVQTNLAGQAIATVNAAIERDLAIQRANLENARDSAAAGMSELGVARTLLQDVDSQEAHAKAQLMEKYALGFEALKQQGLGDSAVQVGQIAASQLRAQKAQLEAQADQQEVQKTEQRVFQLAAQAEAERKQAAAAAARAKASKGPSVAELLIKEKRGDILASEQKILNDLRSGTTEAAGKELDVEKKRRELVTGVDGEFSAPKGREIRDPALAKQSTKEQRSKFIETENITKDLEAKINKLLQLRKEHGTAVGVPLTQAYTDAQTLNSEIMLGLKKKLELGTLDNQSERFLKDMTRDPNAWVINTPESALAMIRDNARRDVESRAQSLGYSSALDAKEEYATKYGARDR